MNCLCTRYVWLDDSNMDASRLLLLIVILLLLSKECWLTLEFNSTRRKKMTKITIYITLTISMATSENVSKHVTTHELEIPENVHLWGSEYHDVNTTMSENSNWLWQLIPSDAWSIRLEILISQLPITCNWLYLSYVTCFRLPQTCSLSRLIHSSAQLFASDLIWFWGPDITNICAWITMVTTYWSLTLAFLRKKHGRSPHSWNHHTVKWLVWFDVTDLLQLFWRNRWKSCDTT